MGQGVASGGLDWNALLRANFAAVPHSIPVIALAFVYQVRVVLHQKVCNLFIGIFTNRSVFCKSIV